MNWAMPTKRQASLKRRYLCTSESFLIVWEEYQANGLVANSKGSQEAIEKQLSEAIALGSYELTNGVSASKASNATAKESSSSPEVKAEN